MPRASGGHCLGAAGARCAVGLWTTPPAQMDGRRRATGEGVGGRADVALESSATSGFPLTAASRVTARVSPTGPHLGHRRPQRDIRMADRSPEDSSTANDTGIVGILQWEHYPSIPAILVDASATPAWPTAAAHTPHGHRGGSRRPLRCSAGWAGCWAAPRSRVCSARLHRVKKLDFFLEWTGFFLHSNFKAMFEGLKLRIWG